MGEDIPEEVDHINNCIHDNRWANLRACSREQNMRNYKKPKNNKSGVKGVHWDSRSSKYYCQIGLHGKRKFLGYFSDIEHARQAYREAADKYHGEFKNYG